MVQDCPWCGLVNPPTAQRCDCGYDFRAGRLRVSHLTDKDRAAGAPTTQYFPSPFPGCGLFMVAVIKGTNGPGGVLLAIAFAVAGPASSLTGGGPGVFGLVFGLTAIVTDALARRFAIRCGALDTARGSKFLHVPVWIFGFAPLLVGGAICLNQFAP